MKERQRLMRWGAALCAALALVAAPAAAQGDEEPAGPSAAAVDVVSRTPSESPPATSRENARPKADREGIDLRLPALTNTPENALVWVIPATGAAVLAGAASFSLLIGVVNWAQFEGARTDLLTLDRDYSGLPDQDAAIVAARGRYESTRRAYDDVGRGLLGAGLAKMTAAVGLAALAGGAYYWRTLDEEDAASDRASSSNVGVSVSKTPSSPVKSAPAAEGGPEEPAGAVEGTPRETAPSPAAAGPTGPSIFVSGVSAEPANATEDTSKAPAAGEAAPPASAGEETPSEPASSAGASEATPRAPGGGQ